MRKSHEGMSIPALLLLAACALPLWANGLSGVVITAPANGDKIVLTDVTNGTITIDCAAYTVAGNGAKNICDDDIHWSAPTLSGATVALSDTTGPTTTISITGLPTDNSSFGEFTIEVWARGHFQYTCTASVTIKLFYPKDATNNAGGGVPNWFYYWSQIPGVRAGEVLYTTSISRPGETRFQTINRRWIVLIGPGATGCSAAGAYDYAWGIDFFAHVCRHEAQHLSDVTQW